MGGARERWGMLEVSFQMTPGECQRMSEVLWWRALRRSPRLFLIFVLVLIVSSLLYGLFQLNLARRGGEPDWTYGLIFPVGSVAMVVLGVLLSWLVSRRKWRVMQDVFLKPFWVGIGPEGYSFKTSKSEGRTDWTLIEQIESAGDFLLFWLKGRPMAYVVPRSAWTSDTDAETFVAQARAWWQAAREQQKN